MLIGNFIYFNGCCEEAVTKYCGLFNIGVPNFKKTDDNKVALAQVKFFNMDIMFSDKLKTNDFKKDLSLVATLEKEDEVRRIFEALSDGGKVEMPLQVTFWSPLYGSVVDKYGVNWSIMQHPVESEVKATKFSYFVNFQGLCEDATKEYHRIFNKPEPKFMRYADVPPMEGHEYSEEEKKYILYSEINFENTDIMFSDLPTIVNNNAKSNFSIVVKDTNEAEIQRIFQEFSKEGNVVQQITSKSNEKIGLVIDKFGVEWYFVIESK